MKKAIDQNFLVSILAIFFMGMIPVAVAAEEIAAPPQNYVAPPATEPPPPLVQTQTSTAPHDTTRVLGTLQKTDLTVTMPTDKMRPLQAGPITYITGGVGDEERGQLEAVKGDYNLHILIANKSGQLMADTSIVIRNSKGDELLYTSAGPVFYARLPAGNYTVEASTSEGQSRKQSVTIGKGNKTSSLNFIW